VSLRKPEPRDIDALVRQKNDPEVADSLVGFAVSYSRADIEAWIERHRVDRSEALWVITRGELDGPCIGHVGLYQIDHRVRQAEFGIMIGDKESWGLGIGATLTMFAANYGFDMLNLNRVHLTVLANNERAVALYRRLGFKEEGCLRQAQFKNGQYLDVLVMSLLREERDGS